MNYDMSRGIYAYKESNRGSYCCLTRTVMRLFSHRLICGLVVNSCVSVRVRSQLHFYCFLFLFEDTLEYSVLHPVVCALRFMLKTSDSFIPWICSIYWTTNFLYQKKNDIWLSQLYLNYQNKYDKWLLHKGRLHKSYQSILEIWIIITIIIIFVFRQHAADVRRNVACNKSGLISPSSSLVSSNNSYVFIEILPILYSLISV